MSRVVIAVLPFVAALTFGVGCAPGSTSGGGDKHPTPHEVDFDQEGLPTDEDLASTPRDDVEAEYVALLYTPGRWVADQDAYDRIARDLAAARAAFPDELGFRVDTADRAQNAWADCVTADVEECRGALQDVADVFHGAASASAFSTSAAGVMSWAGLFQPSKTQAILDSDSAFVEAQAAPEDEEDGPFVDVLSLDLSGDAVYRFMDRFGDCPEGCVDLDAYLVTVDVDGVATITDRYANVDGSVCPSWIEHCPPPDTGPREH